MAAPPLENLTTAALLRLYNAAAYKLGRPGVSEFLDHSLAVARVRLVLEQCVDVDYVEAGNEYGIAILDYRVRHLTGDDRRIKKLLKYCPKDWSSNAAIRWAECLRDEMTIREFQEACSRRGFRRRRAQSDLAHNLRKKWVRLITHERV